MCIRNHLAGTAPACSSENADTPRARQLRGGVSQAATIPPTPPWSTASNAKNAPSRANRLWRSVCKLVVWFRWAGGCGGARLAAPHALLQTWGDDVCGPEPELHILIYQTFLTRLRIELDFFPARRSDFPPFSECSSLHRRDFRQNP